MPRLQLQRSQLLVGDLDKDLFQQILAALLHMLTERRRKLYDVRNSKGISLMSRRPKA